MMSEKKSLKQLPDKDCHRIVHSHVGARLMTLATNQLQLTKPKQIDG
jgi:hypothetical protein